jgi:hypothetical protein
LPLIQSNFIKNASGETMDDVINLEIVNKPKTEDQKNLENMIKELNYAHSHILAYAIIEKGKLAFKVRGSGDTIQLIALERFISNQVSLRINKKD